MGPVMIFYYNLTLDDFYWLLVPRLVRSSFGRQRPCNTRSHLSPKADTVRRTVERAIRDDQVVLATYKAARAICRYGA